MKYTTFIVTMLAGMSVHIMRMGLPFVQLQLMRFFGIHKFDVGIANAGLYIIIGISYLWRAFYGVKNPQFTFLWSMTLSSIFFAMIPICVFLNAKIIPLFYISLAGFGWFQSAAWPILLFLIHVYFHPK
jgi:sugar phosphate permease